MIVFRFTLSYTGSAVQEETDNEELDSLEDIDDEEIEKVGNWTTCQARVRV